MFDSRFLLREKYPVNKLLELKLKVSDGLAEFRPVQVITSLEKIWVG